MKQTESNPIEEAMDKIIEAESKVHEACQKIVDAYHLGTTKAVDYAVNYAQVAKFMTGSALRTQVLYVLGNISHWRGDEAKRVRAILKEFIA